MIGKTVGAYEIESLLGTGGMGEVYRARDTRLRRSVAIKVLNERVAGSAEARKRLIREARALAAIHHPGIATLFGFESIDGCDMLVMELVDGMPLSAAMREGPMDPARVRGILSRICDALAEAHDHGIVHRDLKPDNLMLLPGDAVKILDFGLAAGIDDTRITREGTTFGTVSYMSPEQARGEVVGPPSDVFSVGVIAAELLTGSRVFDGETAISVIRKIADLSEPPKIQSEPDLSAFVESCLQPDPARRPADGATVRALIAPGREEARPAEPRGRSVPVRGIGFAIAVVLLVASGIAFWPRGGEPGKPVPGSGRALAVIPFQNLNLHEEDAWFVTAAAELLASKLSGATTVDVISPERVGMILGSGSGDPMTALSSAGVIYSISGSVITGENGLRVETRLVETATGELRHSASGRSADEKGLYAIVAALESAYLDYFEVKSISDRLEEGWIQQSPSNSVEAYRAFARGREHLSASRWETAISFLTEAVSIDSMFVSAWVDLSSCYWNTGDMESMYAALSRAQALRDQASPRERTWLDLYAAVVEGRGPLIVQYAGEILAREPEYRFVRYLLGKGYYEQQLWQQALDQWEPLRGERWTWMWTYLYSSRALARLGEFAEARVVLDELEGLLVPDDHYAWVRLHRYRGLTSLDEEDGERAQSEFARAQETGDGYAHYEFDRARALILLDRRVEARELLQHYIADSPDGALELEATTLLEGLN
jgi:serine/threonine-protein kinase